MTVDPHATPIAPAVLPDNGFGSEVWPGLSKVTEECGELLQVIGMLAAYPDGVRLPDGTDLVGALIDAAGDVAAAVQFLIQANPCLNDDRFSERRRMKLARFMGWHDRLRAR